jgi:hypothetical protein
MVGHDGYLPIFNFNRDIVPIHPTVHDRIGTYIQMKTAGHQQKIRLLYETPKGDGIISYSAALASLHSLAP